MKLVEIILFSICLIVLIFKIRETNSTINRIGNYEIAENSEIFGSILELPSYRSSNIICLLTCLRKKQCNSAGKSGTCMCWGLRWFSAAFFIVHDRTFFPNLSSCLTQKKYFFFHLTPLNKKTLHEVLSFY